MPFVPGDIVRATAEVPALVKAGREIIPAIPLGSFGTVRAFFALQDSCDVCFTVGLKVVCRVVRSSAIARVPASG